MVSSDKRQRHKEGHRSRMEAARIEAQKARRRRTVAFAVGAVVLVGAVFAAVTIVGDDDSGDSGDSATSTTAPTTLDPAVDGAALPDPVPGAAITGETPCPAADGSSERTTSFEQAPPTCIDTAKTYTAEIATSQGDITVTLDDAMSPVSVNNFVVLARYHYFDGLPFHRVVPGFVNQTGSSGVPSYGGGGPGYDLPEEDPTREYQAGDVAMARSETVSGSQFFFTLDPTALNAAPAGSKYPILGTVTAGQETVDAINALAPGNGDGPPTEVVTVDSVTITES